MRKLEIEASILIARAILTNFNTNLDFRAKIANNYSIDNYIVLDVFFRQLVLGRPNIPIEIN